MRKSLLILFLLLTSHSFAQYNGEQEKEMGDIRRDILGLISPDSFDIRDDGRSIIATLKDTVVPMGLISAPYYTDSFVMHNSVFADLWTAYVIEFRIENKKTEKEKQQVLSFNDSIQQLIKDLPKKLGIEHLNGDKDMYTWHTRKQLRKVQQYEKEKISLYDQLIPLPYFSTQYHDVYVMDDKVFDGYIQHPEWDGYMLVPTWTNSVRWRIWDGVKQMEQKFTK